MDVRKEILRCKEDFDYFARRYMKIVTKDSKLVNLKLNPAQQDILSGFDTNPHLMLLKARQLGSTTGIAAYFFWAALFNPRTSVAVVAHTDEAVKKIFDIYKNFYDHLPTFLRMDTTKSRENEIRFVTGSGIKVGSASTQSFRGGTYQYIHASEYAFWPRIEQTIASLFSTATDQAKIVLESTANGLNEAYDLWTKDNGFTKIFLGWQMDRDYVLERPYFDDPTEEELEYSYENKLSPPQFNWMVRTLRTKCGNNWRIYNQEYPATAEMAFVTSGSRFFPEAWPVVNAKDGYEEFEKPQKMCTYIMGVDTASGSPGGDYSAFMIINATRSENKDLTMAASYYEHIPPSLFARKVLEAAKRFNAYIVIETNSYGLSIVEAAQQVGYPLLYRTTSFDKITNRWQNKIGLATTTKTRPVMVNRLYEYVTRGWLKVKCTRFMAEGNRMEYNDKGKVEAAVGSHDDMFMSTALALMALDQISDVKDEILKQYKPSSIQEVLAWEVATGKLWKHHEGDSDFAPDSSEELLGAVNATL